MIPPTRYTSNLGDRQKQATQDQIMHAVARKLESGLLEDLSFAEIAADAEVGERTVYRHFPTKEALLGAFWAWLQNQALRQPEPPRPLEPRIRDGHHRPRGNAPSADAHPAGHRRLGAAGQRRGPHPDPRGRRAERPWATRSR